MSIGVYVAAPFLPPPPTDVARPDPVRHAWVGWDGSRWDLSSTTSGTMLVSSGVRGLGSAPGEHVTASSPALAGVRWLRSSDDAREVSWPVKVFAAPGQEWVEHDRAWWRTMDRDRPGTWEVTHPDGTVRRLRLRFTDDGDHVVQMPGDIWGWQTYRINLLAEQPFWESDPVVTAFRPAPPVAFLGGGPVGQPGAGPPLVVSPGSSLARARISNPGDVDAWPEWVACGPIPAGLQLGVDGRVDVLGVGVPAGKALVLDGDPSRQWALEADVVLDGDGQPQFDDAGRVRLAGVSAPGSAGDRTPDLTRLAFAPVPPGRDVPLTIRMDGGTGVVGVSLVPRHRRPW